MASASSGVSNFSRKLLVGFPRSDLWQAQLHPAQANRDQGSRDGQP